MKTTMKKSIAYLLAVLLVFQIVPVFAGQVTGTYTPGNVAFREKLEITPAERVSIMTVGMTNQMSVNEGYDKLVWSSDNENVATVDERGLVTAVGPGKVKITISAENGQYSDSITFKVTGVAASDNDGNPDEQLVIIISGDKTKVEYNGQVQTNTYNVTSNKPYDKDKLTVNQEGLASGTECKTYKDELTATYDGDAEVIVSNGWLQIKPKVITVKADDATVLNPNETPKYTAQVTDGLIAGDELDLSQVEFSVQGNYILPQIQQGQIIGNYRVGTVQAGTLTIASEAPLYNIAKIGGSYYKLRKTSIYVLKDISEWVKGLKKGETRNLSSGDYWTEDYDFANEIITVKGKKYAHISRLGEIQDVDGYYEAKQDIITAGKQKIGGSGGFIVPKEAQHNDKNETDSFHRDYTITLSDKVEELYEQPLYNFLKMDDKYYRLQATKIYARPVEEVVEKNQFGTLKMNEHPYQADEYDFSNLVLEHNGKKYVYRENADNLPDQYVSFYTTQMTKDKISVPNSHKLNKDEEWYINEDGWLDGANWGLPNDIDVYHRDYEATFYEGNIEAAEEPEGDVTVTSSLEGVEKVFTGTEITLTAIVTGYENGYDLQWKYEDPAVPGELHEIPGETNDTYTFNLDSTNCQYIYYAIVTAK